MTLQKMMIFAFLGSSLAVKLSSMSDGAKFDKCISKADWEGKTLNDDITLQDRDANGCCPSGSVPGVQHSTGYMGAQVVCGFKADGTVATSTSTSNNVKTCTYNQCYVWKQNLECSSGNQFLNGCCAASASCAANACGFKTDCKNYASTMTSSKYGAATKYCTTYHKDYGTKGRRGTSPKSDDIASDKLDTSKVDTYTACDGGSTSTGTGAVASNSQMIRGNAFGILMVLLITMAKI